MAINDATGQIKHDVKDVFQDVTTSSGKITEIIGEASKGVGPSLNFGGDFVGMDENGFSKFEAAVAKYIGQVGKTLSGFQSKQSIIEGAVKGDTVEKFHEFFLAMEALFKRYVSTINQEKAIVKEANDNWKTGSSTIAGNLSSDANSIRSQKDSITLK